MKTISFNKLYHIGTLNKNNKKKYNLEGINGISVSNIPNAWCKICNYTHGDTFIFTKKNNKFLDFYNLTENEIKQIYNWGFSNDYLKKEKLFYIEYFDNELEIECLETFKDINDAIDFYNKEDIKEKEFIVSTEKFAILVGKENKDNIDLITSIYTEQNTDFDGVFWNDILDINKLSAPRAIIFESKFKTFNIKKQKLKNEKNNYKR